MKTEYEVKFYPIDKTTFRKVLRECNATLTKPEFKRKRKSIDIPNIDLPENVFKWIQVREDDGVPKITLKELNKSKKIESVKELEFTIEDYEKGLDFFNEIGFTKGISTESRREIWKIKDVEITIDEWPGLKPFIEIEADSEKEVLEIVERLGLDFNEAIYGTVGQLYYKFLGVSMRDIIESTDKLYFSNAEEVLKKLKVICKNLT